MISSPQIQELIQRSVQQDDEHAIILLDTRGQVTAWLGAAERIFGYHEKEVVGQSVDVLFTPEDRLKKMPEYEINVAASDGHSEDDRWMLRRDGRHFWASGILKPVRADDGTLMAFAKILRNRTDVKSQMETCRNEIEHLKATNESKDVFIATLAHELRNPLSAICNSLAILEIASSQSDEFRFARTTAQRQIDHMQRMIDDLLEVARADTGKIPLDMRTTPLNDIVRTAFETCRPRATKVAHHFELLMTEQPILVNVDPSRIEQVIVNLIENAAKYTPTGGNIWIKVSVEGKEAVIRVEDTGMGISAEIMPRIFDLFTQAESHVKGSGLGIGLSVVKDLTTLHEGTVQARSDGEGKGSEFTVRLPLANTE